MFTFYFFSFFFFFNDTATTEIYTLSLHDALPIFDEFLLRLTEKAGWHFIPFDRSADYSDYIDGRSRLEGVHAFLGSRGVRLPEGRVDDPAEADTAHVWGAKTLFTTRDHPDLQAEPSAEAPRG